MAAVKVTPCASFPWPGRAREITQNGPISGMK